MLDLPVQPRKQRNRLRHQLIDVFQTVLDPRRILLLLADMAKRDFRAPEQRAQGASV